eukprot:757316-Hanusia_phi.AAC.8
MLSEKPAMTDQGGAGRSIYRPRLVHDDSRPDIDKVVLVIVGVNLASEFSTVAAAIATAPTGTPVSIWVMVQQNPQKKGTILVEYTNNVVKGVLATLAFALGCNMTARSGYDMWPVLSRKHLTSLEHANPCTWGICGAHRAPVRFGGYDLMVSMTMVEEVVHVFGPLRPSNQEQPSRRSVRRKKRIRQSL